MNSFASLCIIKPKIKCKEKKKGIDHLAQTTTYRVKVL